MSPCCGVLAGRKAIDQDDSSHSMLLKVHHYSFVDLLIYMDAFESNVLGQRSTEHAEWVSNIRFM